MEHIPGPIHPLMAALSWSVAVVFFKRAGGSIEPAGLNLFKNLVALPFLVLTVWILDAPLQDIPALDAWLIIVSGAVGIGIADWLFFASLNRLGASRSAVVDTLYSPGIVAMSYVALGERLTAQDGVGALLIFAAISLIVLRRPSAGGLDPLPKPVLWAGIGFGVSAMLTMGASIVAIKPMLDRFDPIAATFLRMVGGLLFLGVAAGVHRPTRRASVAALRPQPSWRFAVPGAFIGTYVALIFWVSGFKYNSASVASVLNQTSTVLIVVLAAIFLKEPLDARRLTAVGLAFCGAILVVLPTVL